MVSLLQILSDVNFVPVHMAANDEYYRKYYIHKNYLLRLRCGETSVRTLKFYKLGLLVITDAELEEISCLLFLKS